MSKGHGSSLRLSARQVSGERPIRIHLLHPISKLPLRDAAGIGAYVEILPLDSVAAKKALAATAGSDSERAIDLLAALTTGWRFVDYAGAPKMSASVHAMTAREFYSAPELAWMRGQVEAALVYTEGAQQCRKSSVQ